MSFLSKLHIDGEEYNVLDFNIRFTQDIDTSGKPVGDAKGGNVLFTIEATQNTNFLAWMINSNLTKDGKIVFYRRDAMSKMKELAFVKAFCIDYQEQFSSTNDVPMKITMELITKEMTFGDAKYLKDWVDLD